ncbi:hypothetical protein [Mycobacterium sp. shizuoka-1]|uniref:hypothetical protein n=1 Tax=Mycobacterium sp. shizuoka-1 TaxID=2039281 RepID=UPI000C05E14B|nr:hypothetical protein [Mycobacterium sp. shizuoka-1]GAY15111.1 hypothetical protein MSZK_18370 [Mycobacterium sp. shizuoka-1]
MALSQKLATAWFPLLLVGTGVGYVLGCLDVVNVEIDDVFITLRYGRNLLAGDGAVFNPGEAVEGYSNPTWLVLVTAVAAVTGLTGHVAMLYLAKVMSMVFGMATLVVVYQLATVHGNRRPAIALLLAVIAVSPFLNVYNSSGMETALVTFLLTLTVLLYSRWRGDQRLEHAIGFAVTLGVLSISRPEAVIYPIAIYAGIIVLGMRGAGDRLRYTCLTAVIVSAIIAAFIAFRLFYYGDLFPNPLYAKNNPGLTTLRAGVRYVALFAAMAVAPYALLALAKRAPLLVRAQLPIYLVIVAQAAFATYAGGDWMPAFRLMLPVVPILLFVVIDRVDVGAIAHRRVFTTVLLLVFVVGCSWLVQREDIKRYKPFVSGWHLDFRPYNRDYADIARNLGRLAAPQQTVLVGEAGVIPYLNDQLRFTDLYGLTDTHLAKDVRGRHFARIDNDYWLSRHYDYVVAVSARGKHPPEAGGVYDTGFVAMDALLNDPRFATQYVPVYHEARGVIFARVGAEDRPAG